MSGLRDAHTHQPRSTPAVVIILRTAGVLFAILGGLHIHGSTSGGTAHAIAEHSLFTAGMMLPLAAASTVLVTERSLRSRRGRAMAEHLSGFVAVWASFGMCAGAAIELLEDLVAPEIVFAGFSSAAAVWQLSERRRGAADRCGYVHVGPASGWRCDMHTIAAGSSLAIPCLRTCGPQMTAMIAAPHVLVMGALFAAYLSEWMPGANPFAASRRTRPFPVYVVIALGGVVALAA